MVDKTADSQPERSSPVDKTADSESERSSPSDLSRSPAGETQSRGRFSPYLQSLAQISGVATIIAATVYALGVFTLVLPVAKSYHATPAVAWYAISVVPKTVVVGLGLKSLAWPSLALTLGTTLFALMVLWVLYILAVGWHHGRATSNRLILNVTFLTITYSFLTVAVYVANAVLFGDGNPSIELDRPDKGFSVEANVQLAAYPAGVLFALSYLVVTVLGVVRGLQYVMRLIASRDFSSVSFRGFFKGVIFKGTLFMGLSIVFFTVLAVLFDRLDRMLPSMDTFLSIVFLFVVIGLLVSTLLFVLLLPIAVFLLTLRGLRFIAGLIAEAYTNKTFPSISALSKGLGASVAQRARAVVPALLYSAILFLALYLVLLVALYLLRYLVVPRIGDISEAIKVSSRLDSIFIPLVVFGTFICLVIMYRKGWKDLSRGKHEFFSHGGWASFSRDLLTSMRSRSLRSGLLWSFGVAYVVALASAFILAYLSEPPLPKVEVNEITQSQSNQSGQVPAFERKELALVAHTEGYWYLIDEKKRDLLVVPDREDKFIRLELDDRPK